MNNNSKCYSSIICKCVICFCIIPFLTGCNICNIKYPFALCDAGSSISVWLDLNGNGIKDINETPMKDVCVWAGYKDSSSNWQEKCFYTDEKGFWGAFYPGACCEIIVNYINPPEGYVLTTPAMQIGCMAKFGLIPK